MIELSIAIASIAGAGPNSMPEARKNVSETEMRAEMPGTLTAYVPARTPRTVNSIHSRTNGVDGQLRDRHRDRGGAERDDDADVQLQPERQRLVGTRRRAHQSSTPAVSPQMMW